MTATASQRESGRDEAGGSRMRRHWLRWTLAGAVVAVVLVLVAVAVVIRLRPVPEPLALPSRAAAPAGPLEGRWAPDAASIAGFRLPQTVLGLTSDAVSRTHAVTGRAVIAGDRVIKAEFRIDLTTIKAAGTQFAKSLSLRRFPDATVMLTRPVTFGHGLSTGAVVKARAASLFTMHGVSRPLTVTLSARRDGALLEVAGQMPVAYARWRIKAPVGFGPLGSLADRGTAEFLLVLKRR